MSPTARRAVHRLTVRRTSALPVADCCSAYANADVVSSLRRAQAERVLLVAAPDWPDALETASRDRTGEYRFGSRCGGIFKFSLHDGRARGTRGEGERETHTGRTVYPGPRCAEDYLACRNLGVCRRRFVLDIANNSSELFFSVSSCLLCQTRNAVLNYLRIMSRFSRKFPPYFYSM